MLREFLAATPILNLPILAMLMFLGIFLTVLVRVSRREHQPRFRQMASLPLADDTGVPPDADSTGRVRS